MKLFNRLFKSKKINSEENSLMAKSNNEHNELYRHYYLNVHKDISDLLWIGDGSSKNYYQEQESKRISFDGSLFEVIVVQEEPSVIYTKEIIEECDDFDNIERPGYFPSYKGLSPTQKFVFWKFLSNPYDCRFDISYVFILYYGLERYLYKSLNIEKVFDVILKLRNVFDNKSFQSYSANTLILTCLKEQRPDLLIKFMESLDNDFEYCFNQNLYILAKYSLNIALTAKDIIRLARDVEFNNYNYIRKYPNEFEEAVMDVLVSKNKEELFISKYVSSSTIKKMHKTKQAIYCNYSLENRIDVPLIVETFKLKMFVYGILETAHNNLKEYLANRRKNGNYKSEPRTVHKKKDVEFDFDLEKKYLNELSLARNSNDILEIHFKLMAIQSFYYKYRNVDENYLNETIKFCEENILMSLTVKEEFIKRDRENFERAIKLNGSYLNNDLINNILSNFKSKIGRIPAFETLIKIYEKKKDYVNLLRVCDAALEYYKGSDIHSDLVNKINYKKEQAGINLKINGSN